MPTAELTDRAVLAVSGTEARDFLQGLLTNDVTALARDRPLYAGLLSAQGKALVDMLLFEGEDGAVLLDVAADAARFVATRLGMYKLRRAVMIAASPLKVFAAWGVAAGAPADPRLPALGARWLATDGAADAGVAAYHAHRRALGVPDTAEIGRDRTLWLEANAAELNGVSFSKGCYVGQENTARMHHRDRVRRRLLPVSFGCDPGDDPRVLTGDREAGELRGHADGLGIAWLRVEHADTPLAMPNGASAQLRWPDWLPRG